MTKCMVCKQTEAIWYVQDIAGDLAVTRPGYHYRGFQILKVCDKCKDEIVEKFKRERECDHD